MEDDKECNTGLSLGLGWGNHESSKVERQKEKSVVCLDLSFTLYPKEKTIMAEDEEEEDGKKRSGGDSKGCKSECGKKKLRLTKEQSSVLEASFKLNTTLNPAQKQALAQRLNLKPRQVEVWFQNRRARTKLKQTEVDCEFLKKCCESLSHENGRLKKELQELRSLRVIGRSPPPQMYHHHHHHLPMVPTTNSTTLAICPSCEKTASGSEEEE